MRNCFPPPPPQGAINAFAFDTVGSGGTGKLFTVCSGGHVMQWTPKSAAGDTFVATPLPGEVCARACVFACMRADVLSLSLLLCTAASLL